MVNKCEMEGTHLIKQRHTRRLCHKPLLQKNILLYASKFPIFSEDYVFYLIC